MIGSIQTLCDKARTCGARFLRAPLLERMVSSNVRRVVGLAATAHHTYRFMTDGAIEPGIQTFMQVNIAMLFNSLVVL